MTKTTNSHKGFSKETKEFVTAYFKKGSKLSLTLNERTKRLNSPELSYRLINYWEKEELITFERNSETSWRKYSVVDVIWLQILFEVRKFGFPIEQLKELKKNLLEIHPTTKQQAFVELEVYMALALTAKTNCYINIFSNGMGWCTTEAEKKDLENENFFHSNPAISISINWLIERVVSPDLTKISE